MRRFVLHKHSGYGPVHWDLMLETDRALATWRIAVDPLSGGPGDQIAAARIHDHRKAYLDYSGPVSGGRGQVTPVDAGGLSVEACGDELWRFKLAGELLRGRFEMRRIEGERWVLRGIMDQ